MASARLFPEVLHIVVENLRLQAIAAAVATSRECRVRSQRALYRRWCCRTCGLSQLHPKNVRHDDGEYLVCAQSEDERQATSREDPLLDVELNMLVWTRRYGTSRGVVGAILFQPITCAGCGKHLGDEFTPDESSGEKLQLFAAGALALHDAVGQIPRRGQGLSRSSRAPPMPLLCSGARGRCGSRCCAPLASMDEVISTEHVWKPIGGPAERAWFVNNVDANLRIGTPRDEVLAQGIMSVADVFCPKCEANVGWKFASDTSNINRSQVGRFGLGLSSFLPPGLRKHPLVTKLEHVNSWAKLEWMEHHSTDFPSCVGPDIPPSEDTSYSDSEEVSWESFSAAVGSDSDD